MSADHRITRALAAIKAAGLDLSDISDVSREKEFLRISGIGHALLRLLREYEQRSPIRRPAHRPPKYPGDEMTSLSIRIPVRLKAKLARISGGKSADWVCQQIDEAKENDLL